jgi:hypothetical protein
MNNITREPRKGEKCEGTKVQVSIYKLCYVKGKEVDLINSVTYGLPEVAYF